MNEFRDNRPLSRFELDVDGQIVWADYRRDVSALIIDHVEAPMQLRGSGVAGELMQHIAAEARRSDLKIVPLCGYAASWLRRHREHADLVD